MAGPGKRGLIQECVLPATSRVILQRTADHQSRCAIDVANDGILRRTAVELKRRQGRH